MVNLPDLDRRLATFSGICWMNNTMLRPTSKLINGYKRSFSFVKQAFCEYKISTTTRSTYLLSIYKYSNFFVLKFTSLI